MKGATEVLLFLLLDLAIIIFAARALGTLARRIGQPAVIGEIVAGIFLGPTVLGRIAPGLPARLFPAEVPLRQLADLGLVFFMFLVGLELDGRLVRKEGRRALAISLGGVVTPFALGALVAIPLLALNNGGVFSSGAGAAPTALTFSLFMGAAMCITAFPVLARILVERGLYRSPLGTSALCAAAVDDVIAWVLLAAVAGLTRTGSAAEALRALALASVFTAGMLTLGRRAVALLARRFESRGHASVDQVAAVVVGLLLSAWVTEWIGIHSIFGAFVFGTIMPRGSGLTRELTDKIEDFTVVVLLPAFFAVAGLRTNLFSLGSAELVGWTVLVVGVAIVGKLVGCGVAARLNGYSGRDALMLGTLMNTRGLTELVILTVGLQLGVLSDRTFAMMVIMALVTTFMAAPIINWLMPRREMVRVLSGGDPAPLAGSRVLVALGNPDNAAALVDAGVLLAGSRRPAELLLVRLIPTPRAPEFRTGLRDEECQVDRSLESMTRLAQRAAAAGVAVRAVSFLSDDVGRDLADVAATQRCDVVLLGWHRPSLERHVVRRLVHRVFELAPCDVVVFADPRGHGIRPDTGGPVLLARAVGDDGYAPSAIAQRLAKSLRTGIRPMDVSIPEPARSSGAAPARGSGRVSGFFARRTGEGRVESAPGGGAAAVAGGLLRASATAPAAVVAVGRIGPEAADFGPLAAALAAGAECPVFIVRASPAAPAIVLSTGSARVGTRARTTAPARQHRREPVQRPAFPPVTRSSPTPNRPLHTEEQR